jgi:hypothetical protein
MVYFLGATLIGVLAFVGLLLSYDLAPKACIYKILGRLSVAPESLRPMRRDAPYRKITSSSNGLHRPVLLNLETSDGSGQACHPDVVFIPEGFGEQKWTYWMVCTPYPYQDERFENPEIFASNDGVNWKIPEGAQNPIVPALNSAVDHYSDPDMIFHENQLWLFYRKTLRSHALRENKLCLMQSADGVRWSSSIEILGEKAGAELLSPAVIHDGKCFVMWTVERHGGEFKIMRRSSQDAIDWTPSAPASVVGLWNGRHPWHIDVIQEEDRLSAVLVTCVGASGLGSRLHYIYSEDHGQTWFDTGFLFERAYEFEANLQYRATLRKAEDHPAAYELWYSAASLTNMFSIAYVKLVREENRLFPFEMRPAARRIVHYQNGH